MYGPEQIIRFFFEAKQQGYLADAMQTTITELPGSKTITVERGPLKLVDCWFVGDRKRCIGNTFIFAGGRPVWAMQYRGTYEEKVIPFLKEALAVEYAKNPLPPGYPESFRGCRGPKIFSGQVDQCNVTYMNMVEPGSDFWEFSGREEITNTEQPNQSRGWHRYHGYMLL
jgi:hypothetical protein